jgi:hypothetical protein
LIFCNVIAVLLMAFTLIAMSGVLAGALPSVFVLYSVIAMAIAAPAWKLGDRA